MSIKMPKQKINHWLDQLGDINPQLFREIKGRLTDIAFIFAVFIGGLINLIAIFATQSKPESIRTSSNYCAWPAEFTKDPNMLICPEEYFNHPLWLHDQCQMIYLWLAVLIMFAIVLIGTYLLVHDWQKEQQRGTLNFIRFSPQSSRQMLWGKLLGVPIVPYLSVALVIPLHLFLGLLGGIELWQSLGFYVVFALGVITFFHFTLLLSTLYTSQGMSALGVLINCIVLIATNNIPHDEAVTMFDWLKLLSPSTLLPLIIGIDDGNSGFNYDIYSAPFNHGQVEQITWLYLPIGQNGLLFWAAMVINFGFWIFWLDRAFQQKFQNPQLSLITKQESYLLVGTLQVIWVGFLTNGGNWENQNQLGIWLVYNGSLILAMIIATLPSRQPLLDWSRYRHESTRSKNWLIDLTLSKNSPINVTILINTMIMIFTMLTVGWFLKTGEVILVYGVAFILFALITMYLTVCCQFVIVFSWKPELSFIVIVVSLSGLIPLVIQFFSLGIVLTATIALVIMNGMFLRRLYSLGKSETKVLMEAQ